MLEIACFNTPSAISAAKAGADRIEVCADYLSGGITPSHDTLQQIKNETSIPINVMIRPRAGEFVYTSVEFSQMKSEIELFKPLASGFVFGILDDKNYVDAQRNRQLIDLAAPLPCTFHRAIDQVPDLVEATEQVVKCGFRSILTSGGLGNAITNAHNVAELQKKIGDKISIIVGGGVRSTNAKLLKQLTNAEWYHSAAITQSGEMVDPQEVESLQTLLKHSTDCEFTLNSN